MYFEDEKCALCGKKLPDKWSWLSFNRQVMPDGKDKIGEQPYFCSDDCHFKLGGVTKQEIEYQSILPEGDEPLVQVEGLLWEPEDRMTYFKRHKLEEPKRIAHLQANADWSREQFIRRWRDQKPAFDKKLIDDEVEARWQRAGPIKKAEPMPDDIPYQTRFEHMHVLAGTGAGKTVLLTGMLLKDIFDERQPAIIVIDGKGTWATLLQRFACFAPDRAVSNRLVFINPQDKKRPAALNMFAAEEALADGVAENLAYIFGARDYALSAKQRTAFTYAAQLVFSMPNPTIDTLLALMRDPVLDPKTGGVPPTSMFFNAIQQLPAINRRFFNELFYHPTEFLETKRQIQNRIFDLLGCPAFASMFMQEENRLPMYDIMQSGKIVIIDASEGAVGKIAASTFGRYIISLALSAARARINIPRNQWRPTFLYIDEAHMFADEERTQPLLQQAREFNLGVILSHQILGDLTPTLRDAFAANTSSKYCANLTPDDAHQMAKQMRTDKEFIESRTNHQFAAYIRGLTAKATTYRSPQSKLEDVPVMSDAQYAELMRRNSALMSPPPRPSVTHSVSIPAVAGPPINNPPPRHDPSPDTPEEW